MVGDVREKQVCLSLVSNRTTSMILAGAFEMKLIIAGVFLAVLCGLTGCAGLAHPTTQTTTEVIVDKTISAMNSINSYNLNTDMTENYTVFGKTDPQQTSDI